jgi:glycylpeptide N-tetradecanoyltransferase
MSFYSLPSLIMRHPKHSDLGTAYSFYYATDVALSPSGSQGGEEMLKEKLARRLNDLVRDCMIVAKDVSGTRVARWNRLLISVPVQAGFDVYNALTLMDNNLFLNEQLVRSILLRLYRSLLTVQLFHSSDQEMGTL